jgi:hypothetical protein
VAESSVEILTIAEAAEGGPKSFKLGWRVMYRRADVERWLAEAHGS